MNDHPDLPAAGYVTAAAVKARYSISNSTLWKWCSEENNAFPKPVRIGPRATRFSVSDLRRYEESFKPAGKAPA